MLWLPDKAWGSLAHSAWVNPQSQHPQSLQSVPEDIEEGFVVQSPDMPRGSLAGAGFAWGDHQHPQSPLPTTVDQLCQ